MRKAKARIVEVAPGEIPFYPAACKVSVSPSPGKVSNQHWGGGGLVGGYIEEGGAGTSLDSRQQQQQQDRESSQPARALQCARSPNSKCAALPIVQ